jgi:hypothetical protein
LLPVILGALVALVVGGATSGAVRYAVVAACVVGAALGIRRSLRLDFCADEQVVTVVNFWRSYRFAWSDVEAVRLANLRVGVVPQTCIAFWVKGRRPVQVQATPIGEAAQREAFDLLRRLAPPTTPVGPDARLKGWDG